MFFNTILLIYVELVNLTIDPFDQAAYLFSSLWWEGHDEVIVIAVVGDWWSYTTVSHGGIKPHRDKNDDPVWGNSPENSGVGYDADSWSLILRYGSPQSATQETEVVTKALQLLEDS